MWLTSTMLICMFSVNYSMPEKSARISDNEKNKAPQSASAQAIQTVWLFLGSGVQKDMRTHNSAGHVAASITTGVERQVSQVNQTWLLVIHLQTWTRATWLTVPETGDGGQHGRQGCWEMVRAMPSGEHVPHRPTCRQRSVAEEAL